MTRRLDVPAGSFFDSNVTVGRLSAPRFGSWLSTDALIEEMDRHHIHRALVTHAYGRELGADEGNEALAVAVAASDRLVPVATIFPPHGRVDGLVPDQLAALQASLPFAVRIHPNPTHDMMDENVHPTHFTFEPDVVASVCEHLVERDIPLLVDMPQVGWPALTRVLAAFPRLRLLILDVSYTHKRSLYSALERHENLYFDTSGFHVHEGIEELVSTFGARRLVLGSRAPTYAFAPAIAMVQYAAISEDDKERIRSGNLVELLGSQQT